MPILRGFLILLGFLMLGESIRFVLNWPISGGVTGMLLITCWLMVSGTINDDVAGASQQLISMLILLIMPGVVSVFFIGNQFSGQWLAIGVALILGTFLSVLTTLLLMRYLAPGTSAEAADE